jgi:hypothetical protein
MDKVQREFHSHASAQASQPTAVPGEAQMKLSLPFQLARYHLEWTNAENGFANGFAKRTPPTCSPQTHKHDPLLITILPSSLSLSLSLSLSPPVASRSFTFVINPVRLTR